MRWVLTVEAMIDAHDEHAAEAQRLAMDRMLGNRILKTFLRQNGVELVGYRVLKDTKRA
jgi:hypothetical protein